MTHLAFTKSMQLSLTTRAILLHILERGSITPLEAQHLYRVMRLAPRILELRQAGHDVKTELRHDMTGKRYAKYFLSEEALAA